MEDLYRDKTVGKILKHFHEKGKPTGLICHGPIALVSALDAPAAFASAVAKLNSLNAQPKRNRDKVVEMQAKVAALAKGWRYAGYSMTSFSTKEEEQEAPTGSDNVLGGFVKFYPDEALDYAGGKVLTRAQKWQSNVVVDRELVTGQNPFSDKEFTKAFLGLLEKN